MYAVYQLSIGCQLILRGLPSPLYRLGSAFVHHVEWIELEVVVLVEPGADEVIQA